MEPVKPALTPEEWRQALDGEAPWLYRGDDDTPESDHIVAALYLHGQPFGFTHDDVRALRDMPPVPWRYGGEGGVEAVEAWLRDLADRIEALLPPEVSGG